MLTVGLHIRPNIMLSTSDCSPFVIKELGLLLHITTYCRQYTKCAAAHLRYTHLTDQTKHHAIERINGLMDGFSIAWGRVK